MTAQRETIDVAGTERGFLLAPPSGPVRAIVLSLHGTRSVASEQIRLSRLDRFADQAGAAMVFPQALVPIGRGYEWDPGIDTRYLLRLCDVLAERYPDAGGRVCLTGMSGGARMSCHFASVHPERVSLLVAVAGLRAPSVERIGAAVPVFAFHGTADRINPYTGGHTARWYESVPDAAHAWAAANGVVGEPASKRVSQHVTRTAYGVEGAGNEVLLWTVDGAGHTWPGTRLGPLGWLFLGRTTTEIDATALVLAAPYLRPVAG
ncbi:MAG TPA: hypothetical protein VME70_07050 [Mycobacteriales bacterium]|nr:hypothetical protein [Mycobacteriales bacterium]